MGARCLRHDRRTIHRPKATEATPSPKALSKHRRFFVKWALVAADQTNKLIPDLPRILTRARKELGIRADAVDHYGSMTLEQSLELDEQIQAFARATGIRVDAPRGSEFVDRLFGRIRVQYARIEKKERDESEESVKDTDDATDEFNEGAVRRQIAAGVLSDPQIPNVVTPILISKERGMTGGTRKKWIKHSLSLIVDEGSTRVPPIPTEHFNRAKKIIDLGVRRNTAWPEVAKELRKLNGISRRRGELIAFDQVNKHNARMTETRHRSMGIDTYLWRHVNDGKVRPEHRAREGMVFQNNNPPPDGHPGTPVGCRCFREPDIRTALGLPQRKGAGPRRTPKQNATELARGEREKAARAHRQARRRVKKAGIKLKNAVPGQITKRRAELQKAQVAAGKTGRRLRDAREFAQQAGVKPNVPDFKMFEDF